MASKNKNKKKKSGAPPKTAGTQAQNAVTDPQMVSKSEPQKASESKSAKPQSQKSGMQKTKTGIVGRLVGVITLKRAIYREIAEDPAATMQAAIIVVVVALVAAAVGYFAQHNTSLPGLPETTPSIGRAIALAVGVLVVWVAGSFVIAQVARYIFQASTNTSEMLRVFGYTLIFQALFILGVFSAPLAQIISIAGLALSIIGAIIGIREAGEITTGKAIITGVFSIMLVWVTVAFFYSFVLNPFVTMLLPT